MVSVSRPLMDSISDAADPEQWLASLDAGLSENERTLVERAFFDAMALYGEAKNPSTGEPLFQHAVAAAAIVADMELLGDAIAATLLFCAEQFQSNCQKWLLERYNPIIAELVSGVSRMQQITELATQDYSAPTDIQARQSEAMRKMLLAMVADIRVVLIKLAWRTQTMHFLAKVPDERTRRNIAQETMDLFAPLANRLGVWQVKWELEDLSFRHLEPQNYRKIAKLLDERRTERIEYIERVVETLRKELDEIGLHFEISGRPKHIYSIWKKMRKKNLDFDELYDIRAVRVLVENLKDCYTVLGLVHHYWHPVPGEFDDYISNPKANDYKSLHTAVIGPEDKIIEVQIRTFEMHEHAEYGVAAHWRYKEGGKGDAQYEAKIAWLRQLLEWREELVDRNGLTDKFQTALFSDTIYVLTPAGKVISLERGATPIDFAYTLHTDIGHRCRGAKIDGQIVPLSTPLESGQRIEILTVREGGPSIDWVHDGWVKTHRAKSKIRQWVRQQNHTALIEAGQQHFNKALQNYGKDILSMNRLREKLLEKLELEQFDDLLLALGQGDLSVTQLTQTIMQVNDPPPDVTPIAPESLVRRSRSNFDSRGIIIEGEDNLMTVLAKCCKPAPPDPISGFITRGRGISIHRSSCKSLKKLSQASPERLITASWGEQASSVFPIELEIIARDRTHLLRDISEVLSRERLNVIAVQSQLKAARAQMRFTVEVQHTHELNRVIARLNEVSGVIEARRI